MSFSDLPNGRRALHDFLDSHGLADYARVPIRALPPTARIRLFAELALLRDGVRALLVTSPERHGAAPAEWYGELAEIAERGIGVVIITDALTSEALLKLGAQDALAAGAPQISKASQS